MGSTPDRGEITDWVETLLETNGYKAKNMVPPSDAGWDDDMVKEGAIFQPYTVIVPQTSSAGTGSMGDGSFDWALPYTLNAYGVASRQVEDLADDTRRLLIGLRKIDISMRDHSSWRIISITCEAIGGIGLNQSIKPNAYSQSDSLLIKVSRNLS